MLKDNITTVVFDADDTLWVNEPYFQEAEKLFCELMENYLPQHASAQELFRTEMQNLPLYGYGVKGFMLCMVETASRITNGQANIDLAEKVIQIGKELLQKPIELLPGVAETLKQLQGNFRLVVATKGDLLDQENKLKQSGLESYFHHIEIMSDKQVVNYQKLIKHLDCKPENFLMLGNSIKSDILPVLELGGFAAHTPYHVTWQHERYEARVEHDRFFELQSIDEILTHLL
ncbi:HAD family hydrolase [Spirosoma gilvum]